MRKYGCFRALYLSFYSRELYRDVAENWGASVILYLLLVLFICWVSTLWNLQTVFKSQASRFVGTVIPQLPSTIVIQKGTVVTPENRPYLIVDPVDQHVIAIIDTSGKYTQLPQGNARILVTKSAVARTDNNQVITIQNIPSTVNFTITPVQTRHVVLKLLDWLWVGFFPFLLLFSLFYRLLQSLFYAAIGTIIARVSGQHLLYSTILKLSIVALTPVIFLNTLFEWIRIVVPTYGVLPHMGLIYFIIAMLYLVFAIRANRRV